MLALAALAHFTGLALEGVALTVTLAAQALGLATLARHNGDRIAGWAAVAFAAIALGHALVTIAPPHALLDGLADPLAAAGALLAVAAAALGGQPRPARRRADAADPARRPRRSCCSTWRASRS